MPNLNLAINCWVVSVQRNMAVLSLKQITTENQKPRQEKLTGNRENVSKELRVRQGPFSALSECSFMMSHRFSYTKITYSFTH